MAMKLERAVFLDKDGTLVENVPYNVNPARVALTIGAGEALRRLKSRGYRLVVVSNQSGIAQGRFSEDSLAPVEARIQELLKPSGVAIDAFYYCPHLPNAAVARYALRCDCRKPRAGMIRRAAAELALDARRSWLIGDILDDVEAGNRAGCRTALLVNGNETEWRSAPLRLPDRYVRTLGEAARIILAADAHEREAHRERRADVYELETRA